MSTLLHQPPTAGGWGKPPVDEFGRPIYGNVFGLEEEEADEDEQVGNSCLKTGHTNGRQGWEVVQLLPWL